MRKLLFHYCAARWKYPGPSAKRYIRAGLGLDRRARALSVFWTDHLSRSRAAQSRWAKTCTGGVLTVLGAGPLLDLNAAALAGKFKSFRLVDANPMLVDRWAQLNQPVEPVITDVTRCLPLWCDKVKALRGSWEETLGAIRDLGQTPVHAYSAASSGLLSLNILSQLEIGWQEAVEPILQKRFGKRFVTAHEQDWLNAIRPGSQALIEQHLAALEASAAPDILLICDLEYIEYTGRMYQKHTYAEPPVKWIDDSWQADEGILYEAIPALEGVVLNHETFAQWLPSYELEWHESWRWHIAPNGTETTKYGKLHRVGAFALRAKAQR